MNDLKLMKVKGGHSWPPILCEDYSDVLCGHFCPSLCFTQVLVQKVNDFQL